MSAPTIAAATRPQSERLADARDRVTSKFNPQVSDWKKDSTERYYRTSYEHSAYTLASTSKFRSWVHANLGSGLVLASLIAFCWAIGYATDDLVSSPPIVWVSAAVIPLSILLFCATHRYRKGAVFTPVYAVTDAMAYMFETAEMSVDKIVDRSDATQAVANDMRTIRAGFHELLREYDRLTSAITAYRDPVRYENLDTPQDVVDRHAATEAQLREVVAQVVVASWTAQSLPYPVSPVPAKGKPAPVVTVLTDDAQEQMLQALERLAKLDK